MKLKINQQTQQFDVDTLSIASLPDLEMLNKQNRNAVVNNNPVISKSN